MARELYRFPGGVRLPDNKAQTRDLPPQPIPIPSHLILPVQQHVGIAATPCVEVGQQVLRGQRIAKNDQYVGMSVHAPTSGVVRAIESRPTIHPAGIDSEAIVIESDGNHTATDAAVLPVCNDPTQSDALFAHLATAGIVGLGGAGFPTQVKIREGASQTIDFLIINGVECEPYITCDESLIRESPAALIEAAQMLARALDARECIIAVEDDMTSAQAALEQCGSDDVEIIVVPAIYPAGGEKQLIKTLTGREVPSGMLPIDVAVVVFNVATVYAIYEAVFRRQPLLERVITVTGSVNHPGNYRVLLGTPVEHLLKIVAPSDPAPLVLSGGPMMGTRITDFDAPVVKTTNCLLVDEQSARLGGRPCIRCGDCVAVCPVGLQPQQLYDSARLADFDTAQDYHLFDCIECGCCAYVCPSHIPLVHHYRHAKSAIEALDREAVRAEEARDRFTARDRRNSRRESVDTHHDIELAPLDELDDVRLENEVKAAVARAQRSDRTPPDDA